MRYRIRMTSVEADHNGYSGDFTYKHVWLVQYKRPGWFKPWTDVSVHIDVDSAIESWNACLMGTAFGDALVVSM